MSILPFRRSADNNDEHDLVRRVAGSDQAAFELLYRRYYPRLFRYILRITHRLTLVEEILNDVMMAVWQAAGRFQGRSKVSTWILGIAYRQSMKALDRERRAPSSQGEGQAAVDLGGEDRSLLNTDLQLTLNVALQSLSPRQRAVVELTFYHGYSYPEIARIVDCPVNTVKTRMFHARRLLRNALADDSFARNDPTERTSS